jgi:hypothetical protein
VGPASHKIGCSTFKSGASLGCERPAVNLPPTRGWVKILVPCPKKLPDFEPEWAGKFRQFLSTNSPLAGWMAENDNSCIENGRRDDALVRARSGVLKGSIEQSEGF